MNISAMKYYWNDDLGPNRGDHEDFQTDDEDNQEHRASDQYEADTESDIVKVPSPDQSHDGIDINTPSAAWPQSYWQSMDMYTSVTPLSLSFLTAGASFTGISSPLSASYKRQQYLSPDCESASLSAKLLNSETSLDDKVILDRSLDRGVSTLTAPPEKLSIFSSFSKFSVTELPPAKEHCCSFSQALLNGTNVLCGIGLLTTPYALREGGWLSIIMLFMFCVICCYTGTLLKRCLESCPGLRTYPDIAQAAFGPLGRLLLSVILYLELYGACVEFLTMMSDNLSALFPNTTMSVSGIHLDSNQIFAITATLVVLPTVWLQNLSLLSYLSVGGVIASILVALCLLWVGVVNQVGFHHSGTALNLANLSVTIGIYGFCYAGHSVFPNIYTSMREPSQFSSVLITSFAFCFLMYTGVAVCGYLMFGDAIQSQFTLNMPKEFVASKIAVWTTIVCPMTKYALTMTPVALSVEELFPQAWMGSHSLSICLRTLLVLSTLVVALNFPFFGSVMAFIGSLVAMLVAVIFPCLCYLRLHKGGVTKLEIAFCILIILVGVVCSVIGTYSAITRISDQID